MKIIPHTDGLIPSNEISFTELQKKHPNLQGEKEQSKILEKGDWVIEKIQGLSQQYWSLSKPHSDDIYHRFIFGTSENPKNRFWYDQNVEITMIKSNDVKEMETILKHIHEIIHS